MKRRGRMKNVYGFKGKSYAYVGICLGLLLLVLQGCQTPFIDIKVNACGEGTNEETTSPGGKQPIIGLCNKKTHGNANVTGFWDDATQSWMPQTNKTCMSGTVCRSPAGTCSGGVQTCINHYNSTTKACNCACPPTL
jgi:hypothetical protein